MTQKIINIGTAANKGDGDVLRTAFSKINDNFTELYAATAADVQIPTQTDNGGKYLTTNGSTLSWATVSGDGTTDTLTHAASGNTASIGNNAFQLNIDNNDGSNIQYSLNAQGMMTLTPGEESYTDAGVEIQGSSYRIGATTSVSLQTTNADPNPATANTAVFSIGKTGGVINLIRSGESGWNRQWTFGTDGNLTLPGGGQLTNGADDARLIANSNKLDTFIRVSTYDEGDENHFIQLVANAKIWRFEENGILTLPNSGSIISYNGGGGVDLKSSPGPDGYIGLVSSNSHNWMWVNDTAAYIDTSNGSTINTWTFDTKGTLTVPHLFPRTFTATVDDAHYDGTLTLTGDAWYFSVTFNATSSGTIETLFDNNPWPSNPGYTNGMEFTFTEEDHGVPGYTLTLTLNSIQNPIPEVYTVNPAVSQPPAYPATIKNGESIKLTADATSWTFGANGTLTLPDGANVVHGDVRLSLNVDEGTAAYLTTTTDDTTALYMTTTGAQLYASESVSISVGAGVADLENTYIGAMAVVEFMFAEETLTPGYPWGITLPVSHATYAELILLAPDTFTAQAMITVAAKTASDAWDAWQLALGNTNISIVTGNNSWEFGIDGTTLFPNGAKLANGAGYQFATDNTVVQSLDLRDTTGRGFYTNNDGFTLRSNGSHNWVFKSIATLNLPNFGSVPGPTDGAVGDICRNDDVLYFKTSSGWATINLT